MKNTAHTPPGSPLPGGLEAEFDDACTRVAVTDPLLEPIAEELLAVARHNEEKARVLEDLRRHLRQVELYVWARGRRQPVIDATATLYLKAIVVKRELGAL